MLAESLLKNRDLEAVCEKSSERGGAAGAGATTDLRRDVFCGSGLPYFESGPFDVSLSCETSDATGAQLPATVEGVVRATLAGTSSRAQRSLYCARRFSLSAF